ncbi:molybdenum cofactor biosynthesis protein MoeB [Candidatus Woesearchaeota archaeon]|nr:molybdenum cofactor biosynthesis protein MoeB [Candidatus Woesearchaeota archaeon]|tara:strand:+ start:1898 stop:3049 length:1152 start_codon:yes stop_codon:yes gene_type:complete
MKNNGLTKEELIRYSRHLMLPEVGKEGQQKLKQAKVLIIGAGGLGSPAAIYLAAAGVGTIGIVDFDDVEESNLQRQILYTGEDIGKEKTAIIKNQLKKLNPNINVITHDEKLTSSNALEIIKDYDLVIDGSDNFPTRYLVNDACVLLNKPDVYGSIFRFDGQTSVFNYDDGPCYRCLFPNPPPRDAIPSCSEGGVLGVLPGVIGTIQATEAIKIILGKGDVLSGRYLVYNALGMKFKELKLNKNKNCPVCGESPTIKELIDYEQFCNGVKEKNKEDEITVQELKKMIDKKEDFELIDIREKIEQDMCKIDGAKLTSFTEIIGGNMEPFKNIDKDKKIVLYCHTDNRSGQVQSMLKNKGYKNVKNLAGGINQWAREIDKEVPIY